LRSLEPEYFNKFSATANEIRKRIPINLPKIMELTEWHHPEFANSELPSNNQTFKQIGKVLETGKVDYYKPTKKTNNHWKNWPNGGTL
jgi:hypothetical protein